MKIKKKNLGKFGIRVYFEIISVLLVCYLLSRLIYHITPIRNADHVHLVTEIITIVISFMIFIVSWYSYENKTNKGSFIGIGFLAVAFFTTLHIISIHLISIHLSRLDYSLNINLRIIFRSLSGMAEIIVLMILIFRSSSAKFNKFSAITGVVMLSLLISTIAFFSSSFLPNNRINPIIHNIDLFAGAFIILAYGLTLFQVCMNTNEENIRFNSYLFRAILIAMVSHVLLENYIDGNSFGLVYGHVLKITYYFYIFNGIFVDTITFPYMNMERAYIESEEKFKNAFQYAAIGVALADVNGNWMKVNVSLAEITGYSEEELLKTNFQGITHPEDLDIDQFYMNRLLKNEMRYYHLEKRYIHKKGHIVWVLISVSLVRDEAGEPLYFIAQIQDITEKKRREELQKEIDKSNRLLFETVELDRLRTEFFANLSHEFRTPLNVILGSLQLMELQSPKGASSNVKIMKQNCLRLVRLINNLIDVTKIDAGFYKLNLQNCNIVSVIEDITQSVTEYTKAKGIDLVFDTDEEEIITACDPDKIERIILNLLSNAIKFTPSGGSICVIMYYGGDSVKISVKDTGIGIPEDKRNIIFERFRQIDKSLTRNHEGSGIGLSLVKQLVEMHDGKIYVDSELEKGSEFIIQIPVRRIKEKIGSSEFLKAEAHDMVERINVEFSDIYFN